METHWNWWEKDREALLKLVSENGLSSPLYVYSADVVRRQIVRLKALSSISRLFYALKANTNPDLLRIIYNSSFGFECVSPGEIEYILNLFPSIAPERILFTPNFVPKEEYLFAFQKGVIVNVDSLYPIEQWPEVFSGRSFFMRIDTGTGKGHHQHVKTAGQNSKFGIPIDHLSKACSIIKKLNCKVIGLHAHVGSGIKDGSNWKEVADSLYCLKSYFPQLKYLNLGGGLGVVEDPSRDKPLDLQVIDDSLRVFKDKHGDVELWLEPGRFVVAESGVLLCKVTQLKSKTATKHFVGVNAGFNSLVRPILYQAYHPIVNLTRLGEALEWQVDVVGMICESGDVLGENRSFPVSKEGDIVVVAVVGAYGKTMASEYNMRKPAEEVILSRSTSRL